MTSWPTALRATGVSLGCALTLLSTSPLAVAEDAAAARAQARAAAADVRTLTARVGAAQTAYDAALANVGQQVDSSVRAQVERDDSRLAALRAQDHQGNTARALYMGGGQGGLVSTLLSSTDPQDLAARLVAIDRVVQAARAAASLTAWAQSMASERADAATRAADASVVTASLVAERAAAVDVLVATAQRRLDRLSARAKQMTEAEEAARALARAKAAAAAAARAAIGSVRAQVLPAGYFALYRAAAPTCPGLPWTLLAAVGQVESGHGRNNGPSSAGAVGPMQFMPRTFATYAVDGDHDGRADPWSPADAVFTAAKFLCSSGAGSPQGVQRALLSYNNAQWYVDLVVGVQAQIAAAPSAG